MNTQAIDAMVAERLFGWNRHIYGNFVNQMQPPDKPQVNGIDQVEIVPHYSTNIAAAFAVVEKMTCTTKDYFTLEVFSSGAKATFQTERGEFSHLDSCDNEVPLCICLAALRAHGIDPETIP